MQDKTGSDDARAYSGNIYLKTFRLPDRFDEAEFLSNSSIGKMTCYDCKYPFGVFTDRVLPEFEFAPITIFYGSNGSGKSTILNVIAERLGIAHTTVYNRSDLFDSFASLCRYSGERIPEASRIIASDNIFDRMFTVRSANFETESDRRQHAENYRAMRYEHYQLSSLDDLDRLKDHIDAWHHTKSKFIRDRSRGMIDEHSNGETALQFFCSEIGERALYLLDEPENSLSAKLQLELCDFIRDSVRFFKCQFVISTHSPFLLALDNARVYDLDLREVCPRRWTELESIRIYRDFFMEHGEDFEQDFPIVKKM